MEEVSLFRFLVAFLFVLSLLGLFAWAMKRWQMQKMNMGTGHPSRRLGVVEMVALDHKRRLALVRRDDVGHLILLGADNEIVIETNIALPHNKKTKSSKGSA